jgi:hypothetical protein
MVQQLNEQEYSSLHRRLFVIFSNKLSKLFQYIYEHK